MKNIYYFRIISKIGGIETFFRELSKKYKDWDITFVYQIADPEQLKEIRKYCRCIEWNPAKPQKFVCDRAFFNFNLDIIDYIEAKEKILVVHGNYEELKCNPPRNEQITKVVAVSKDSADAYTKLTGIPCRVCYNPLVYEEYKEPIRIICACRLEDSCKGGNRVNKFVKAMDAYCKANNENYTLEVFTNRGNINSENVCVRQGRLNIRPYLKGADYLLQLSDCEGYCYSVVEMLYLFKKPVITTPLKVFKELGIDESMAIYLDFDMKNVDEVVKQIFERKKWNINYEPPVDNWDKLLAEGESTYQEEKNMKYKVKVKKWDSVLIDSTISKVREVGEVFEVDSERLDVLNACDKLEIEVIEKINDKKVEVKEAKEVKETKAKKRK